MEPMKKSLWNPLFWHEHPNPWVRRPFIVVAVLPLFLVFMPFTFGWLMIRDRVKDFVSAASDFFEDAWDDICGYADVWWRGVRFCPRIWWQPVDQHEAYAKKLQGDDDGR